MKTSIDDAFELPAQMRQLLDEASVAYQSADRKAYERWLERMKP